MKQYKEQTQDLKIVDAPAPQIVVIPVIQHTGAPVEPKVAVGDTVKLGQMLGSADAFVTAPVHASVSGKVVVIEPRPHPSGSNVLSIVIENDGADTVDPGIRPYDPSTLDPMQLVEIIKTSGIVGLSGSAFPTHVKLAPPKDKHVDTLIINAAECEPYLTADHRLLLEETDDVIQGVRLEAQILGVQNIIIAIEDNKLDAVRKLKAAGVERFARIALLKTKYPAGAEKVLVRKVTGRQVPPLGIPLDVRCVVSNVGTVAQIARTLRTGMPLIDRIVTVAGEVENPGNYRVRIGTRIKDLVKFSNDITAHGPKEYKLLIGGPLMGLAQVTAEVPILKGSSGVLLLPAVIPEEQNCVRCGRCVDSCPVQLMPFDEYNVVNDNCMECGLCAFICPAKRHLVQRIKIQKTARQKVQKR